MWSVFAPAGVSDTLAAWSEDAANWAVDQGYWAITFIVAGDGVIPLFPGETVVVTGGNLANQGKMSLPLVILAGFVGAILGDNLAYWLGRAGGDRIHRFFRRWAGPDRVAAADRMVIERGPILVTAGRFLPGIRLAINLACGAGHMTWKRFVTFNSLGAIIWSVQAAMLGYAFGTLFQDQHWLGLLVAIGVSLVVGGLVGLYEHRKVRHTNAMIAAEKATARGESDA